LTLCLLQDFSSRETDFHFCLFLFKFFRYLSSNFLSFHPYNIFAIYFSNNFLLLKSLFSTLSNYSYLLTSVFTLLSNSAITSFIFSKSSSLFQLLCSTMNSFYHTRYFTTSLIFLLFNIFFTSYSSISSTYTPLLFLILYYMINIYNWVNSY